MKNKKNNNLISKFKKINQLFLNRRPHRSFRLTKKRDYAKHLSLPGYILFTKQVFDILWRNRKQFIALILIYALMIFLFVGLASQDVIDTIRSAVDTVGSDLPGGDFESIEKTGIIFLTVVSGGLSLNLTDIQRLFAGFLLIISWLSCIWMLRNIVAGNKIKTRDAIYNSGAPIIPTIMVSALLIIQALPMALALIGYVAAKGTGLLDGGIEAMMFWVAATSLIVLSLYWMTSTFVSLVIITLPGMYPYEAIRIGSDLVVGRRLKILLRILWMMLLTAVGWVVVFMPLIIFDGWLKSTWDWYGLVPTIPIVLLLMSSFTIVWVSSYIYLFYRRIVSDDATSA